MSRNAGSSAADCHRIVRLRNRVSRAAVSLLANTKKCVPFLQHPAKKRSRNYWLGSPFVAPVRGVRLVLVRRPLAAGAAFVWLGGPTLTLASLGHVDNAVPQQRTLAPYP